MHKRTPAGATRSFPKTYRLHATSDDHRDGEDDGEDRDGRRITREDGTPDAMKAVLQRVKSASVTVDGQLISSIGRGILVLAGVDKDDTSTDAQTAAAKLLKMRLWDDDESGKRWRKTVVDVGGEVLCVSQFTLMASTKKGKGLDFHRAAGAEKGYTLYKEFFDRVRELYDPDKVKDGVFQAMMDVALVNDGPVGLDYRCIDSAVSSCGSGGSGTARLCGPLHPSFPTALECIMFRSLSLD